MLHTQVFYLHHRKLQTGDNTKMYIICSVRKNQRSLLLALIAASSDASFAYLPSHLCGILIMPLHGVLTCGKTDAGMEHTKWGIIIIVFSILGGGTILGLIGGILALVYSPRPVGSAPNAQPYSPYSQPAPQQPITRICPQCGRVLDEDVKFCPHCGRQLS